MDVSQRAAEDPCKRSWLERISARGRHSASTNGCLPEFFVVGPPRTGTSWLYEMLRGRVILPRTTKETRFFDTHFHRGLEWYRVHYPRKTDGRRIGEVAPTYLASVEARERIAHLIPAARVVCIFRDPVERILSLYRLKRAYGLIPWSFEQALVEDPELMNTSRYSAHYRAWQSALGRHQVMATITTISSTIPSPSLIAWSTSSACRALR